MAQSLAEVYIHLVFSTSGRNPYLNDPETRSKMHAYLAGASKGLGCPAIQVGGVADHVHLLARLGKTTAISDWVRELKKASTGWAREEIPSLSSFSWQSGYGAFSTDPTRLQQIRRYIEKQDIHHPKRSFQDEFRAICKQFQVELDEQYAWD